MVVGVVRCGARPGHAWLGLGAKQSQQPAGNNRDRPTICDPYTGVALLTFPWVDSMITISFALGALTCGYGRYAIICRGQLGSSGVPRVVEGRPLPARNAARRGRGGSQVQGGACAIA